MTDTILVSLMPLILASALVPVQIIVTILLLQQKSQGLTKGVMFVLGLTLTRMAQGLVFGVILYPNSQAEGASSVVYILLTLLGILLLIAAYKKWQKQPDPHKKPALIGKMINLSSQKIFLAGLSLPLLSAKLWVFTLSAISIIGEAVNNIQEGMLIYFTYLLCAQILLILPIVYKLLFPKSSQRLLDCFTEFLEQHNKAITVGASLVFGILFLVQGIQGLWK